MGFYGILWDFMGFYRILWDIPSGDQTWLAGKSPNSMEVSSWEKLPFLWWIFQQAMFDYRRVLMISFRTLYFFSIKTTAMAPVVLGSQKGS